MALMETKAKAHANGSLSFWRQNKLHAHSLWVTALAWPQQINGSRSQSMHQAHWYPRSYQPGNLSVTIRCRTQLDYQHLANFVRLHHRNMLETPGLRFSGKANSVGLRHLLLIRIPSEAITIRGWIPSFTITKRGVFEVAPEYTFEFFCAIDPYSSDPIISHQIRQWWNSAKMKPTDPFAIDPDQGKPNRNEDSLIRPNPIDGRGD